MTLLTVAVPVLVVSAAAAVTDLRTGRIPNALTLPAALLGLSIHGLQGGAAGLVSAAAGLLLSGALPWLLHRATGGRAIGGGDVKLFAALGALAGPVAGLEIQLSAFVLLATFAVVRLAFAGRLLRVLAGSLRLLAGPLLPERWRRPAAPEALTEMRMGPAIAAGAVAVLIRDHLVSWMPWLV